MNQSVDMGAQKLMQCMYLRKVFTFLVHVPEINNFTFLMNLYIK